EEFGLPGRHFGMQVEADREPVLTRACCIGPDPIGAGFEVRGATGVGVREVPGAFAVHTHGHVDLVDHLLPSFHNREGQPGERRLSDPLKRGSKMSLSESPSRLAPSTTIMMARP